MIDLVAARRALRLSSTQFDDEIHSLLAAAEIDLGTAGIAAQSDDALYDNAMRMYLRGNFWPEDELSKRCLAVYEEIKGTMKLIDRYRKAGSDA